jgi:hypothetical protein
MNRAHTCLIGLTALLLCTLTACCFAQEKKLIQFGFDMKNASELATDIDKLQDQPFDGLTILTGWCYPFYSTGLGSGDATAASMKKIKWGRFTDNFMYMTSGKKVDWFDDKVWADDGELLRNVRQLAKVGVAAGCKGILFDPEFIYWGEHDGTWQYSKQLRCKDKTFAEFEVMARKRGVQVIRAINEYMPNTNFLTLCWGSMERFKNAAKINDQKLYQEIANGDYYGLLSAFMCGILDGADGGTRIIDGDEQSYYNNSADDYRDTRKLIKEDVVKTIIPADLREKYRSQAQCGFAIFADFLSNTQRTHNESTYMTAEERAQWMEHNVYWALKTSDHYVWFYNENVQYLRNKQVAPEMKPAIALAEQKVNSGQPLDFTMDVVYARAHAELLKVETGPIITKTAKIPHLAFSDAAPVIDGVLNDAAWKNAAVLGPFVSYAIAKRKELYGSTIASMMYDGNALYIAFECNDPDMKAVTSPHFDEHENWSGDAVDIIIADANNKSYYHIRIDPDNRRWDALTAAGYDVLGTDSSWTGAFKSAVHKGGSAWTVEMAIPWSAMKMSAPKPGDKIKGDLERRTHRWQDNLQEVSSWSQRRRERSLEIENFGTWIFQ